MQLTLSQLNERLASATAAADGPSLAVLQEALSDAVLHATTQTIETLIAAVDAFSRHDALFGLHEDRAPHPPASDASELHVVREVLWRLLQHRPYDAELPDAVFSLRAELLTALVPLLLRCPPVFTRVGEAQCCAGYLTNVCGRLDTVVARLSSGAGRNELLRQLTNSINVIPAYFHDGELRPLMTLRARWLEQWYTAIGRKLDFAPKRGSGRKRLRCGVFRLAYTSGAELAALRAHLLPYDRDSIEIVAYALTQTHQPEEVEFATAIDRFVVLGDITVFEAADRIREDDLDVFFTGMNVSGATNYAWLLAAHRLARLQVANTLCPATTALESFDCYLTGALNEPEDAASSYTETLACVPGAINRYDFGIVAPEPEPFPLRARLGLPDDAVVFASGANFLKIVPELLDAWGEALERVPSAVLVLYPFNPNWWKQYPQKLFELHLRRQLARRNVAGDRLVVLPPFEEHGEVLGALSEADLYLDSFPFSGAVSCLDPLSVACPIVAREGRQARCRQSSGLLRYLGLGDFVTTTRDDYVDRVVRLGADAAERAKLRERVRNAAPSIFRSDGSLASAVWKVLLDRLSRA